MIRSTFSRPGRSSWPILVVCGYAGFYVLFAQTLADSVGTGDGPERINAHLRLMQTALVFGVYLIVAVRAATWVHVERSNGTWDSLLATPRSGREVVWAKLLYACTPLLWLVVGLLPLWLISVFFRALAPLAIPALLLVIGIYGFSLAAVGVFQSMHRQTAGVAIFETLGIALFANGLGQALLIPLAMVVMIPLPFLVYLAGVLATFVLAPSVPIVVVYAAAFSPEPPTEGFVAGFTLAFAIAAQFFLFGYLCVGGLAIWKTISTFDNCRSQDAPSQS